MFSHKTINLKQSLSLHNALLALLSFQVSEIPCETSSLKCAGFLPNRSNKNESFLSSREFGDCLDFL